MNDLSLSVLVVHMARSPHLWKDPDVFRPERFSEANSNPAFMGHGQGIVRRRRAAACTQMRCTSVMLMLHCDLSEFHSFLICFSSEPSSNGTYAGPLELHSLGLQS